MDENLNLEGNIEIENALKEFESKSNTEVPQKAPEILQNSETPKMVQLVMKFSGGVIKEQKTAEYVLLGFIVVTIGLSLYLFFKGGNTSQKLSPAELEQMKNMMIINP